MRPEDPAEVERMAAGVLCSMRLAGYDYPVRRLRRSRDSTCVTLPLQVRNFLALERGDWLVFGETPWRGVAAFAKVSDEQYQLITADGRKEFRKLARKIQGTGRMVFVVIPPAICKLLSAEVWDPLIFGLAPRPGMITIAVVKGGGDSTGSRRSG